eukprot:gnl/MRDRNA2_/MRDRNA2_14526_c0_seq1.p1 gnl/MRDRNA2_/MRDRNA2_14526_c0~~gnl/MRDRNA2_/MRDRNA2_14526_c0_seq1.p1  ORF type:complete len:524 (+),score=86.48 gnl/MRDRNA2_/MRDRNA2_14526_c0_seq1:123-1574(+)
MSLSEALYALTQLKSLHLLLEGCDQPCLNDLKPFFACNPARCSLQDLRLHLGDSDHRTGSLAGLVDLGSYLASNNALTNLMLCFWTDSTDFSSPDFDAFVRGFKALQKLETVHFDLDNKATPDDMHDPSWKHSFKTLRQHLGQLMQLKDAELRFQNGDLNTNLPDDGLLVQDLKNPMLQRLVVWWPENYRAHSHSAHSCSALANLPALEEFKVHVEDLANIEGLWHGLSCNGKGRPSLKRLSHQGSLNSKNYDIDSGLAKLLIKGSFPGLQCLHVEREWEATQTILDNWGKAIAGLQNLEELHLSYWAMAGDPTPIFEGICGLTSLRSLYLQCIGADGDFYDNDTPQFDLTPLALSLQNHVTIASQKGTQALLKKFTLDFDGSFRIIFRVRVPNLKPLAKPLASLMNLEEVAWNFSSALQEPGGDEGMMDVACALNDLPNLKKVDLRFLDCFSLPGKLQGTFTSSRAFKDAASAASPNEAYPS